MPKTEEQVRVGTRRLILGFDGGCFTCSGLARRIEEQAGGKLEVLSLSDPQMEAWRRKALGENAPWTPTLIEIKDLKVRAWTGPKMGIILTRILGPASTWRVMQVLGELERLPVRNQSDAETAVGMSRRRFLAGVGGAAVAMSVMAGNPIFTSVAGANTEFNAGTVRQRGAAETIIRNSNRFKTLSNLQREINATFDFSKAEYRFRNRLAVVQVHSAGKTRGIIALFMMDVQKEKVFAHFHQVWMPNSTTDNVIRADVLSYTNGKVASNYHHIVSELLLTEQAASSSKRIYDANIITNDGIKRTVKQFRDAVKLENERRGTSLRTSSTTACERCRQFATDNCEDLTSAGCNETFTTLGGAAGGCAVGAVATAWSGPGTLAGCAIGGGIGFIGGSACQIFLNYSNAVDSGCAGYANAYSLNGCGPECLGSSTSGSGTCDP